MPSDIADIVPETVPGKAADQFKVAVSKPGFCLDTIGELSPSDASSD